VSIRQGRPWTAELSAADVGEFAQHPAFIKSNMMFSVMWMLIFAWFAFANWQELSAIYRWVPMILGGVITVIGPKLLMRIGVKRGVVPPQK
jgi:arginine exporter protein ArgO